MTVDKSKEARIKKFSDMDKFVFSCIVFNLMKYTDDYKAFLDDENDGRWSEVLLKDYICDQFYLDGKEKTVEKVILGTPSTDNFLMNDEIFYAIVNKEEAWKISEDVANKFLEDEITTQNDISKIVNDTLAKKELKAIWKDTDTEGVSKFLKELSEKLYGVEDKTNSKRKLRYISTRQFLVALLANDICKLNDYQLDILRYLFTSRDGLDNLLTELAFLLFIDGDKMDIIKEIEEKDLWLEVSNLIDENTENITPVEVAKLFK